MISLPSLFVAAMLTSAQPPEAATRLLAAVGSGDLAAARATLAEDAPVIDSRTGSFVTSTLEAFAEYVRPCRQSDLYWDADAEDPGRAAVTVTRDCPSGQSSEDFIWTQGERVVHVQFGLPLGPSASSPP
jgi:hypothetical protein